MVGLEFQGLTGIAAISLTGGAAAAAPPPLDADGVPTLTADLTEIVTIRETLHNVDRLIVSNQAMVKDGLRSFETYTATLASKGDAIDSVVRESGGVIDSFGSAVARIDGTIAKIDTMMPSLVNAGQLYRACSRSGNWPRASTSSAALMRADALGDVSQAVNKVDETRSGTGR